MSARDGGGGSSSAPSTDAADYQVDGTFTMDLGSDPGSVNPYKSTGGLNRQIYAFAYDTLVGRDSDSNPVPQVASSWKVTPTAVTYTIRKDVTCGDGTSLKPSD